MEKAAEIVHVWLIPERVPDFIVMEIKRCDLEQYPPFYCFFAECFPPLSLLSQVDSKEHPAMENM